MKKQNQVVSFRIGKELFGVYIQIVQEIVRVPEITPVPEMPSFVEGVINLRGKIVSVVDLGNKLRLESSGLSKTSRVLIVEIEHKTVGLLVDAVTEIIRIPPESIEPTPDIATSVGAEYIVGVGKLPDKLIILLDLKNILRPEELKRIATDERGDSSAGGKTDGSLEAA